MTNCLADGSEKVLVDGLADGLEEVRESGFFFGGEMTEHEIDVAELGADRGIVSAEA